MIALRAALLLALPSLLSARWCQVENVKADVEGDYTFAGPWRVDTCTTLLLDHGKCDEDECPHRKQFEDEEIIELADALHGNTVLTALDLGSNKLTDESVKALAEALRDNEALIDLSLRDNQIGDEGALSLSEVLAENPSLNSLNLEKNAIGEEGCRALMDVHASNKSALDELYLRQNPCPNWMFAQIEKMNEYHMRLPEEGEEYIADDDEPPMLDDGDDDDEHEGGEKDEV